MRSLTLNFYTDPGHGWAKVNKKVLIDLGIAAQISAYSYQRGDFAYLEEDWDLSQLMTAAKAAGIDLKLKQFNCRIKQSKIRSYRPYRTDIQAAAWEAALKAKICAQGCSVEFMDKHLIIKAITL